MGTALVVYESLFGDGRALAEAIARGLSDRMPAAAVAVGQAPAVIGPEVGLLVVGCPNHQLGMPQPRSRQDARRRFRVGVPADRGLREWLVDLHQVPGVPAAAFDTRLDHPRLLRHLDRAARTEEKLLRQRGFVPLAPAEHFSVAAATGPLLAGEQERAFGWGRTLAALVLVSGFPAT